ncbi:IPT/TIG domain-containing protein [Rufibacter ruber]|uniref:IPT/TIG domain-containing protein n=1 Tax=Rufibacter ruber TaxID=1783499 RepID=UPI000A6B5924|nr:IPT/TIG domain-containing protein [Rufibacter ruber]
MLLKINKYVVFLLAVLFLAACDEDNDPTTNATPVIVSLSPETGTPSTIVTIMGRHFSPVRSNNVVKFNGTAAVVIEASEGELQVVVPENGTTGNVTVTVAGQELTGPAFTYAEPQEEFMVSTFAGSGTAGLVDGMAEEASFRSPEGVAFDLQGNVIVIDRGNNGIRRITPAGLVSTLMGGAAGNVDGPLAVAQLNLPWKSTVDGQGNIIIADRDNHKIRKVSPAGVMTTIAGTGSAGYADGPVATARFNQPLDVAVDKDGNIYVADNLNHRIRKISTDGTVSTVAGNGQASFGDGDAATAAFRNPSGLTLDLNGNIVVADRNNHRIRLVTPQGQTSTVAGTGTVGSVDGAAATARFSQPYGVAVDKQGNIVVADLGNHKIRKISTAGAVTTMGGTSSGFGDGPGTSARFNQPTDVTVGPDGYVYVADLGNNRIRVIRPL